MPSSDAFLPIINNATGTQVDCKRVATAIASASTPLLGNEILVKCLTQPAYIRLGTTGSTAISDTNGYYMAVGDEVRWQTSKRADLLYYIRATGTDGALSIAFGNGS